MEIRGVYPTSPNYKPKLYPTSNLRPGALGDCWLDPVGKLRAAAWKIVGMRAPSVCSIGYWGGMRGHLARAQRCSGYGDVFMRRS